MRRLDGKSLDTLTTVHKLVGAAWVVCAGAVLVLAVPGLASGSASWATITTIARIGAYVSVATLVLGLAYHVITVWGPLASPLLLVKWVLYVVGVAASGYSIVAARQHAALLLVGIAVVELAALVASMGIGVYLERSRHAGKLAASTSA